MRATHTEALRSICTPDSPRSRGASCTPMRTPSGQSSRSPRDPNPLGEPVAGARPPPIGSRGLKGRGRSSRTPSTRTTCKPARVPSWSRPEPRHYARACMGVRPLAPARWVSLRRLPCGSCESDDLLPRRDVARRQMGSLCAPRTAGSRPEHGARRPGRSSHRCCQTALGRKGLLLIHCSRMRLSGGHTHAEMRPRCTARAR